MPGEKDNKTQTLVVNRNTENNRREEGKKGNTKQMQNPSKKGSSPQRLRVSKQGGEEKR